MKFLQPEFLFGLFAIAIPIIVHLFKFRKARKIYFSNTRFIQEVKKSTSSKRRLKHLLILISRILFITFLVFAFAQPIIPSKQGISTVNNVYFYVDNSLSMTNNMENGMTGLDDALSTVDKIIDIYPANTNFKLLTNDFAPWSNGIKSKNDIRELLTEIRRSYISRSFKEVYQRLMTELPGDQSGSKEIYYISDFQRSTFGIPSLPIDSIDQLLLMPKIFPTYKNVFIDTVYLENPFLMGNQENSLFIVLKNLGMEDVDDLSVKFFINNIQVSSSTVDVDANDQSVFSIKLSMPLEKINHVKIEFEEFPVTFDNEFLLVLNKSDRINITEIKMDDGVTPIELVYGNSDLFRFSSQLISNIDYSQIAQADLVVINALDDIENSLQETLVNYVKEGGTLLIIPNNNGSVDQLQKLTGAIINRVTKNEMEDLQTPDTNNPFFEDIFEETEGNIEMPHAQPIINWYGERRSILKLKNNEPFLSELNSNIYIISAPMEETFTNFTRHAIYVPVMYKIASNSKEVSNALYYSTSDNTISYFLDSLDRKAVYKLKTEESEVIPGQNISGNQLILQIPKYTLEKGFYDLMNGDKYLATIALNIDKNESILAAFSEEELMKQFGEYNNVSIFNAPDSKNAESEIRKLKFGTPLWKYALILSLLFLLCEVLLIRFFK